MDNSSRGAGSGFAGQNQDDSQAVQPQDDIAKQPIAPISGPHKEVAPPSGNTGEYLRPAEAKQELSNELTEAGVSHTPEDKPDIPHEAVKVGVAHAKENVVHHTTPTGVVSLPEMSQQQALVMKKRSMKDAAKWLAMLVIRQFDKIAYQKLPTK